MTALLEARRARISVDDAVAMPSVDLVTTGNKLVVAGHAGPLMAALMGVPQGVAGAALIAGTANDLVAVPGDGRATGGTLLLAGHDVVARAHLAHVGAAPLDPPAPADWTVDVFVTETMRLGLAAKGVAASGSERARRTTLALERTGMIAARRKQLKSLHVAERRVAVLAAALASDPAAVVADRPLAQLDGQAAEFVYGALEAIGAIVPLIASVGEIAPGSAEGTLARSATDVAAFVGGELSLFGPPGEMLRGAKVFRVTVRSNVDALKGALESEGATLAGGPTRFTLRLPEGKGPSFVLGVAATVRSAVVEIVPLL